MAKELENPFRVFRSDEKLLFRCRQELNQLGGIYESQIKKIEMHHRYWELVSPKLPDRFFLYNPITLVLGEQGSGKTTFINWLLGGKPYPGSSLGSRDKQGTSKFTILECFLPGSDREMEHEQVMGDESKPFGGLRDLEEIVKDKLVLNCIDEGAAPLLRYNTIIDTPSPLMSPEGIGDSTSATEISLVCDWFIELAERVVLVVDASQEITSSDWLNDMCNLLSGQEDKLLVVLSHADALKEEHHVSRAVNKLIWILAKKLPALRAPRVRYGCFYGNKLAQGANRAFFAQAHRDLYDDFLNMPRVKVLGVANTMVKRGQYLITLSYVVRLICAKCTYFKKGLIIKHLGKIFVAAKDICKRPADHFPPVEDVAENLQNIDLARLELPSSPLLKELERFIYRKIPDLIVDHQQKMLYLS